MSSRSSDFAVVGAGVFGVWIARQLRRRGHSVTLLDAYGGGNSRASSGGETRIIRMGYGPDALYTRSAIRSLAAWKDLFASTGSNLFVNCGMLWLGTNDDQYSEGVDVTLTAERVPHERLTPDDLRRRFSQFNLENVDFAVFEPGSGVLLARRAVTAVLDDCLRSGVQYVTGAVVAPTGVGKLSEVRTAPGESFSAGAFVFACGPWLPKLFPALLRRRIFPTRQEIVFFGVPPGARHYGPASLPAWLHRREELYGLPDIENRGVKIACDFHGPAFDPDSDSRVVSQAGMEEARKYVTRRFPELRDAPIVETRVCQYENTFNGDFLLDRHPEFDNVWLAGGGSGHGFKHGPVVGEYLAGRILDSASAEPRFSLATKLEIQHRAVY